jgi:hypothetical protein
MVYRFYKVGKLLHFIALMALAVAVFALVKLLSTNYHHQTVYWWAWFISFVVFLSMSLLAELDGYSRFQNYKQVKDQIYLNGYQQRLLKPLTRSSCQREAAILAGDELGVGEQVRSFFYSKGYRWYHIIPDFVFQYPLFFFSRFFWRTTFFTPYYQPKIDYSQLDLTKTDLILKGIQFEAST